MEGIELVGVDTKEVADFLAGYITEPLTGEEGEAVPTMAKISTVMLMEVLDRMKSVERDSAEGLTMEKMEEKVLGPMLVRHLGQLNEGNAACGLPLVCCAYGAAVIALKKILEEKGRSLAKNQNHEQN